MPQQALLCVIRTGWITRRRPDSAIFFTDEICFAKFLCTAVAPFIAYPFVQVFGKGFGQPIGKSLSHDGTIVVVLCLELVAQLLQVNPAGYRETAHVVR